MQLLSRAVRPKVRTLVGVALLSFVGALLTMALLGQATKQAKTGKADATVKKESKKDQPPPEPAPTPAPADGTLLQILPPVQPTEISLKVGEEHSEVFEVSNAATEEVRIEQLSFTPLAGGGIKLPDVAEDVKVEGLRRVALAKGERTNIVLMFPAHAEAVQYTGMLYYTTEDAGKLVHFHTFKVSVEEPKNEILSWGWAALVALVFGGLLVSLTLVMKWTAPKTFVSFFQSPDLDYSVSKVQIWIWTLVIVVSFVYIYFRQGTAIDFPPTIWLLLSISVSSKSAARFVAVRNLTRRKAAGREGATHPQPAKPAEGEKPLGRLTSMLSEGNQLSLMRLQMFVDRDHGRVVYRSRGSERSPMGRAGGLADLDGHQPLGIWATRRRRYPIRTSRARQTNQGGRPNAPARWGKPT